MARTTRRVKRALGQPLMRVPVHALKQRLPRLIEPARLELLVEGLGRPVVRRPSDHDAFDLVDGQRVRRPVVELRRLRRRVPGDLLRVLEGSPVRAGTAVDLLRRPVTPWHAREGEQPRGRWPRRLIIARTTRRSKRADPSAVSPRRRRALRDDVLRVPPREGVPPPSQSPSPPSCLGCSTRTPSRVRLQADAAGSSRRRTQPGRANATSPAGLGPSA